MINLSQRVRDFLDARGFFVRRSAGLSVGVNFERDWSQHWRLPTPAVVFDVGAHRGESVARFHAAFPQARILAFEPVRANYAVLEANCRGLPWVSCFPLALSESVGNAKLTLQPDSQTHSLERSTAAADRPPTAHEIITVTTLDSFATSERIDRLDFLKIDTEGHELAVLRGATGLLTAGRVGAIFAEASLDASDNWHTALPAIQAHLAPLGFHLAGLYDQVTRGNPPILAYTNALFLRATGE